MNTGRTRFKKGHKINLGKHHSDKTKKKISEANKGLTPWIKGKKHTEETKKKISEKKKGNKSMLGFKFSEESKKKMSESHKGYRFTEEHKRKQSEALKGEKCWLWKGGISFEPYTIDWTESLRKSIRERDHYTCRLCNKPQGDVAHDVHHIDYNKRNCDPNNLITLCHSCNAKVNFNREFWINHFNKLN